MSIFDSLFGKRKRLRFTGENPPPELWTKFPNWRPALEEEGEPGQDEGTLMPSEEQSFVEGDTTFTGGAVRFADGRTFPALLEVRTDETIDGCQVYESANPWRVYFHYPTKKWRIYAEEWLPEAERPKAVSMSDTTIFPLEVRMLVPWRRDANPSVYEISSDGRIREKKA